jgi:hypothetical protein
MARQHTIALLEGELAELIRASDRDHVVNIAFGPHCVWLSENPTSHWAHVLVAKRRGILKEEDDAG